MDKNKLKEVVASELIIVATETKGKRPTQLNFEEMIDVVTDVVNKVSAYPMCQGRGIYTTNNASATQSTTCMCDCHVFHDIKENSQDLDTDIVDMVNKEFWDLI